VHTVRYITAVHFGNASRGLLSYFPSGCKPPPYTEDRLARTWRKEGGLCPRGSYKKAWLWQIRQPGRRLRGVATADTSPRSFRKR